MQKYMRGSEEERWGRKGERGRWGDRREIIEENSRRGEMVGTTKMQVPAIMTHHTLEGIA